MVFCRPNFNAVFLHMILMGVVLSARPLGGNNSITKLRTRLESHRRQLQKYPDSLDLESRSHNDLAAHYREMGIVLKRKAVFYRDSLQQISQKNRSAPFLSPAELRSRLERDIKTCKQFLKHAKREAKPMRKELPRVIKRLESIRKIIRDERTHRSEKLRRRIETVKQRHQTAVTFYRRQNYYQAVRFFLLARKAANPILSFSTSQTSELPKRNIAETRYESIRKKIKYLRAITRHFPQQTSLNIPPGMQLDWRRDIYTNAADSYERMSRSFANLYLDPRQAADLRINWDYVLRGFSDYRRGITGSIFQAKEYRRKCRNRYGIYRQKYIATREGNNNPAAQWGRAKRDLKRARTYYRQAVHRHRSEHLVMSLFLMYNAWRLQERAYNPLRYDN